MLPVNFDTLAAEYPELRPVWAALRDWFSRHGLKRYAELELMKNAAPAVNPFVFLDALRAMMAAGMLEKAYKVRAPSGDFLEGEYRSRTEIPETLPDRLHRYTINTDQAEVIPGYRWEVARGKS
jgi:hypothetical protein